MLSDRALCAEGGGGPKPAPTVAPGQQPACTPLTVLRTHFLSHIFMPKATHPSPLHCILTTLATPSTTASKACPLLPAVSCCRGNLSFSSVSRIRNRGPLNCDDGGESGIWMGNQRGKRLSVIVTGESHIKVRV